MTTFGDAPTQWQTYNRYMPGIENRKQSAATSYTAAGTLVKDSVIVKSIYDKILKGQPADIGLLNGAIRRMQVAVNLLQA